MLARLLTRSMIVCALFAVLGSAVVTAQGPYPRIKVIEEFTSATCPPCAGATPNMNVMTNLQEGVVSIRYHMNYPTPNDPWNLANPSEASIRHDFYAVTGIPAGSANGNPVKNPAYAPDVTTMKAQLSALSATTPVQLTITQEGGKIKVRVKSDIALAGHTLHVVMVSRYYAFADVAAVNAILTPSRSNGEVEFNDMMNKMYPDANGTALTLPANGDQTFEFAASMSNNSIVFPAGQQYVIAFVQSNTTKQIVQGGVSANMTASPRTFTYLSRSNVVTSVANVYGRVARGATVEKDVTVTNNSTVATVADLGIANTTVLTQVGMSAEFTPSSVSLAANESKVVKLKVTAPSDHSVFIAVEPSVSATDGIPAGAAPVYYLVEGARVVNYYGLSNPQWAITAVAGLRSSFGPDVVYMPYTLAMQAAYPASEFDASVFAFDVAGRFQLQGPVLATVTNLLATGKGVWMSGQANMYSMFEQSQLGGNATVQSTRDFYKNVLGVEYAGLRIWVVNNTLYTFPVDGVASDSIGKGIPSFTANQRNPSWPTYAEVSDVMRLTATSKAKPWLYYRDSASLIGGIRVVTPSGGRAVYTSLDLASVSVETTRNTITQQVLNWILNQAASTGPILTLLGTSLQYGNVEIDQTKDLTLPIRNTGTAPLIITNMIVEGTDALAFEVTTGGTASGDITIAPNATHNVTVRFAPTMAKTNYIASLTFSSNATVNPTAQLRGGGVTSGVETDVVSETGAIGLRLMGANPVTDATEVELRSLTNTTVTIVDQAGRVISTIFNGNATGTQRVALQTSTLPAGTYNVVASNGSERAVLSIVVVR